jgi:hypothetical protein
MSPSKCSVMKISKITEDSMGFGNTHRFWATPKREFFTKVVNTLWSGGRDRGEEVTTRMGLSRDMVPARDEGLPNRIEYFEKLGVVGKSLSNLGMPNGLKQSLIKFFVSPGTSIDKGRPPFVGDLVISIDFWYLKRN